MRRFSRFFCAAAIFAGLIAPACAAPETSQQADLSGVKAWVGKRAFDKIDGAELWEFPPFKTRLEAALGPENMSLIQSDPWQGTGPQSEVRQKDAVVYMSLCRQHSCLTDGIKVFIDLKRGAVEACLRKTNTHNKVTEHFWLSSLTASRQIEEDSCVGAEDFSIYEKFKTPSVTP